MYTSLSVPIGRIYFDRARSDFGDLLAEDFRVFAVAGKSGDQLCHLKTHNGSLLATRTQSPLEDLRTMEEADRAALLGRLLL